MKRFLIFGSESGEAHGGMDDYVACSASLQAAKKRCAKLGWAEVLDTNKGELHRKPTDWNMQKKWRITQGWAGGKS